MRDSLGGKGNIFATIVGLVMLVLFGGYANDPADNSSVPPPPSDVTAWHDQDSICWNTTSCCDKQQPSSCVTWTECEHTAVLSRKAPEVVRRAFQAKPEGVIRPHILH